MFRVLEIQFASEKMIIGNKKTQRDNKKPRRPSEEFGLYLRNDRNHGEAFNRTVRSSELLPRNVNCADDVEN